MGFVTMGAAAVGVMVFAAIGPLAKRFDERLLLLVLGILPMLLGRAVMLPIPGVDHPPVNCFSEADWAPEFHDDCDNITMFSSTTTIPTTIPTTTTFPSIYRSHDNHSEGRATNTSFSPASLHLHFLVFIPDFIGAMTRDNPLIRKV